MEGSEIIALHRIITGLLVSSAQQSTLADTLKLLLRPKIVDVEAAKLLDGKQKQLLLAGFQYGGQDDLQWSSAKYVTLVRRDLKVFAISGLAAFPLPIWPFFGNNPKLDAISHFIDYATAYHPGVTCSRCHSGIQVRKGNASGILYYSSDLSLILSAAGNDEVFEVSIFSNQMGAMIFKRSMCSAGYPIKEAFSSSELSKLQYSGSLKCRQVAQSQIGHHTNTFSYIQESYSEEKAQGFHDNILSLVSGPANNRDSLIESVLECSKAFLTNGL